MFTSKMSARGYAEDYGFGEEEGGMGQSQADEEEDDWNIFSSSPSSSAPATTTPLLADKPGTPRMAVPASSLECSMDEDSSTEGEDIESSRSKRRAILSAQQPPDPRQVQAVAIQQRRAKVRELQSKIQQDCLALCRSLLPLQRQWRKELDDPIPGLVSFDHTKQEERVRAKAPSSRVEPKMKRPLPHAHATAGATRNLSYSVPTVTDNTLKRSAKTPSRRRLHWRSNEREAIRRGILMFGVGRSEKVRNVMRGSMKHLQHGLGDIADCSWDFVRACSTYSDVRDRVFVENLLMRAGDLGIEVGPDVSERVGRWEKIEKSGAIWVKRIRLLDNLGHVIQFCASPETQEIAYNAIDTLDDSTVPCDWWTRQSDLALLAGIYRHGFGNYEAIKTDEEFAEAFRPAWESMEAASTQKGMHSNNHDQGTSKSLYERNSEAEFLSREASTDSWPESNVLTRRLKRLVEHLMQVNEQVL